MAYFILPKFIAHAPGKQYSGRPVSGLQSGGEFWLMPYNQQDHDTRNQLTDPLT